MKRALVAWVAYVIIGLAQVIWGSGEWLAWALGAGCVGGIFWVLIRTGRELDETRATLHENVVFELSLPKIIDNVVIKEQSEADLDTKLQNRREKKLVKQGIQIAADSIKRDVGFEEL